RKFTMFGVPERADLWSGHEAVKPSGEHATDLWTRHAIAWLESVDREQPFFLYLAYNAPHTPIQPPDVFLLRVRQSHPELDERRARLVALIEHLDASVGRVLDTLDRIGARDDTLVIFTSDNGGQSNVGANNGPYRGGKQQMYEGGLRVPLCASWPGRIAAGSSTETVAISMDLHATCCAAAGISIPEPIDGVNLLPTLLGEEQAIERDLFWTRREGGTRYMGQTVWAVRSGSWKLLQDRIDAPFELYDLAKDPYETTDLRAREPERYQELAAKLRRHLQRGGRQPWLRTGK
ncbi:MAG: sulfatase-like hydrolase/transferase, partial [Planctomycetes bacterium]|nr:sulfatase-like hydrolase/transferase [Planctomycetota bacterium]